MVFQAQCSFNPINSVLKAEEYIVELIRHISKQKRTKDENIQQNEGDQAGVEADGDVGEGIIEEGEQRSTSHFVDGPGLDQDWKQ